VENFLFVSKDVGDGCKFCRSYKALDTVIGVPYFFGVSPDDTALEIVEEILDACLLFGEV